MPSVNAQVLKASQPLIALLLLLRVPSMDVINYITVDGDNEKAKRIQDQITDESLKKKVITLTNYNAKIDNSSATPTSRKNKRLKINY